MDQKKKDVCDKVVSSLITKLEAGVSPWIKPWVSKPPHNPVTGTIYKGMNHIMLSLLGQMYANTAWLTFNQIKKLGANVRKGEKGTAIFKPVTSSKEEADGKVKSSFYVMVHYVWNIDQCDNLPEGLIKTVRQELEGSEADRAKNLIKALNNIGAVIKEGGHRACFIPSLDEIRMPNRDSFLTDAHYAAVLGHEFIHWTGEKKRLDRNIANIFGSPAYANEELVAELGAAILCALFGIQTELQHTEYLESWISCLKEDATVLYRASSAAQKAIEHLQTYEGFASLVPSFEVYQTDSEEGKSEQETPESEVI